MTAPATRTPTSWQPPERMTFEQWEAEFQGLIAVHDSLPWMLGDCLNAGQAAFREEYSQVFPETRWAQETLRGYQWVCEKVPAVLRRTNLSFSHHKLIARLDASEQRTWLDRAEQGDWACASLRQAMKALEVPASTSLDPAQNEAQEPAVEILPPVARPEPQITFDPQGGQEHWRNSLLGLWRAGEDDWRREIIEELKHEGEQND